MHEKVSGMACLITLSQRRHVANPPFLQTKMITCSPEVLEACSFSSERQGEQDLEGQGYFFICFLPGRENMWPLPLLERWRTGPSLTPRKRAGDF